MFIIYTPPLHVVFGGSLHLSPLYWLIPVGFGVLLLAWASLRVIILRRSIEHMKVKDIRGLMMCKWSLLFILVFLGFGLMKDTFRPNHAHNEHGFSQISSIRFLEMGFYDDTMMLDEFINDQVYILYIKEDMKDAWYRLIVEVNAMRVSQDKVYRPTSTGSAIPVSARPRRRFRSLRFHAPKTMMSLSQVFQIIVIPSAKCKVVARIKPV